MLSGKGGHAHVQVVPIPARLKDKVEEAFIQEGLSPHSYSRGGDRDNSSQAQITFEEDPEAALASCAGGRGNYFRVDLPDGRKMVHLIRQGGAPFSIQFGR